MALFVACIAIFLVSILVFGGGQIFIPFFIAIWNILSSFGVDINDNTIDAIITIVNATPGVVSTKLAFITGYLIANGEWWGFLTMFVTYFIFIIVPIVMMFFSMKFIKKIKTNGYMIRAQKVLIPIVAGIMFSLSAQLLLSSMLPFFNFNGMGDYFGSSLDQGETAQFFSGWRFWVLIVWVPIAIIESIYLLKKNINILIIILINIVLGFILFEPWLYIEPSQIVEKIMVV